MSSSFQTASFPMGSLFGVPVRMHMTFPLFFALGLVAEGLSYSGWAAVGWAALMFGPILLVTVLLHELGHALAARRLGGHAEGILLWPLGGLAYLAHSSGPKADLLIALAGPATHVPQFLVWFGILFPVHHAVTGSWTPSLTIPNPAAHFGLAVVAGACQLNLALAAFNLLLPAYPLDGGRVFADTLLLAGVAPERAAKATAGVAVVGGCAVVGLGVWWASYMTIAVGLWMLYATWGLVDAIRRGAVAQHPMFCFADDAAGGATQAQLPAVGAGSYRRYGGEGEV